MQPRKAVSIHSSPGAKLDRYGPVNQLVPDQSCIFLTSVSLLAAQLLQGTAVYVKRQVTQEHRAMQSCFFGKETDPCVRKTNTIATQEVESVNCEYERFSGNSMPVVDATCPTSSVGYSERFLQRHVRTLYRTRHPEKEASQASRHVKRVNLCTQRWKKTHQQRRHHESGIGRCNMLYTQVTNLTLLFSSQVPSQSPEASQSRCVRT